MIFQANELIKKIDEITYTGTGDGFLTIGKFSEAYFHLISEEIEKRITEDNINPEEITAIQIEINESEESQPGKVINLNIERS